MARRGNGEVLAQLLCGLRNKKKTQQETQKCVRQNQSSHESEREATQPTISCTYTQPLNTKTAPPLQTKSSKTNPSAVSEGIAPALKEG